ncbi:MAG: hypothetical protein ACKVN9_10565 [Methylophilaceae bacterium]
MKNFVSGMWHIPEESREAFVAGMQHAINSIPHYGIFAGDQLFTVARNLSFLSLKNGGIKFWSCQQGKG